MEMRVVPLDRLVDWPEAHARTGMVLVQPHIELELGQVGYRLKRHLWTSQLQTFRAALEQAGKPFSPEVDHSHFVVLPEYSLPSGQFATCEALVLEILPPNSVCIAGFDAMDPDRWQQLLTGTAGGDEMAAHARSVQHDWVNGAVIWVKDREGRLHRFLQAKLRPNPQEQRAGTMYRGAHVLYLTAGQRTFSLLLCYDFIARIGTDDVATRLWQWLQVSAQPPGEHPAPAYLFVLQDNERPDHTAFLDSARVLLTNPDPRFETVLFVNRAGASGQTCLLCSKGDCPPTRPETAPDDVPRLYRREGVGDSELTRLSFRAGEPALHRFIYEPRFSLPRHAGSPREPIDYALLHPIRHGQVASDGLTTHASQHVVTSLIREASPRTSRPQPLTRCRALHGQLEEAYLTVAHQLQSLPAGRLHGILDSLLHGCHRTNPDFWEEHPELRSIRWMIEALYVLLAGGVRAEIADVAFPHITADCGDFTLTIIAGDGQTRPEYLYGGFLDRCYDRRPHLFLLLDHQGTTGSRPVQIEQQEVRRMGAGGALQPFPFDDGPFGRQPNEERIDATQLYWYDRRALLDILWHASDCRAFLRMLMEVFPWRAA
ncbi:MAG: hypothetical protein ACOY94_16900 [Bacillota bacterium]